MKKQTSKLNGAALDWVVAKCEGVTEHNMGAWKLPILDACTSYQYSPSIHWAQGGPIIEREEVSLQHMKTLNEWHASIDNGQYIYMRGHRTSPLIAAMRCYVASKLGDEVDIPDELGGA